MGGAVMNRQISRKASLRIIAVLTAVLIIALLIAHTRIIGGMGGTQVIVGSDWTGYLNFSRHLGVVFAHGELF
jgi:hypothetical protein